MKLASVDAARAVILDGVTRLAAEDVALAKALGRTLASDVIAARPQPPFDASAMDGWAVRSTDRPVTLRIVGESAAGRGFAGRVGPGEAVRIFTGAPVPAGADTVVIQEDALREGQTVIVPASERSRHIRAAGCDFDDGAVLLRKGARLDPWRLALAAASGRARLEVAKRPTVAILSTGDEVVEPGAHPGPFQIFNSGTTALAALVRTWGGAPEVLKSVGDDLAATSAAVAGAGGDVIVTVGGASVGDYDLVKPAMADLGLTLLIESVDVRPGKPTWFGILADGRRVLGLPGNPASAMVCAELFLRPLIAAMLGAEILIPVFTARAAAAMPANQGREHWMRARLNHDADGALAVAPFADQDSSMVRIFSEANALVRRLRGAAAVSAGEPVDVLPLARS